MSLWPKGDQARERNETIAQIKAVAQRQVARRGTAGLSLHSRSAWASADGRA